MEDNFSSIEEQEYSTITSMRFGSENEGFRFYNIYTPKRKVLVSGKTLLGVIL